MRISHQHKFIFFAVPRTGSTTVRRVLDDYSDIQSVHITETSEEHPFYHHISPREVVEIFDQRGWDYSQYRTFCFARNPFDRVVSLFHHRLKMNYDGWVGDLKRRLKLKVMKRSMFSQFVEQNVSNWGRLEEPVSRFISDDEGFDLVDDTLFFEEIEATLPEYLKENFEIGVPKSQIPHKNSSKRKNYRSYFDPSDKKIVKSVYEEDIDRFGYSY
jgi:hypothetical protein